MTFAKKIVKETSAKNLLVEEEINCLSGTKDSLSVEEYEA
jgi:hypothetical protein